MNEIYLNLNLNLKLLVEFCKEIVSSGNVYYFQKKFYWKNLWLKELWRNNISMFFIHK